jgi:hypothetical protein
MVSHLTYWTRLDTHLKGSGWCPLERSEWREVLSSRPQMQKLQIPTSHCQVTSFLALIVFGLSAAASS